MTELEEVAQVIYEKDKDCWPLTRKQAEALAWAHCAHETQQVQDGIADALMELNKNHR